MLSQRAAHQSLRRITAAQLPSTFALSRFAPPAAVATSNAFVQQTRLQATESASQARGQEILAQQRLHRPVSPHLTIYKPQITWYPSALNRITGSILSGGLYIFGFSYLVAPVFGWNLTSASLAAAFGSWPVLAKVLTKFTLALPFTFHSLNGLRHLSWDFAIGMKNKQVQQTGWTVVGLSIVSALGLVVFL